jgi:hypothetical protein
MNLRNWFDRIVGSNTQAVSLSLYAGHVIDISEKEIIACVGSVFSCAFIIVRPFHHQAPRSVTTGSHSVRCNHFYYGIAHSQVLMFRNDGCLIVPGRFYRMLRPTSVWPSASVIGHAMVGFLILRATPYPFSIISSEESARVNGLCDQSTEPQTPLNEPG